ncbi:4a-hydroxytetrahydrobiopterin dehydratase [Thiohalospira sp.]|uniref:4a-hydroxytetrahydrobiopterin dehydratase n=1 Tax=Thiohalospira sp. TaxID=3080549 RepID=UPI003980DB5A
MALAERHCTPCEGGQEPLDEAAIGPLLAELNGDEGATANPWTPVSGNRALKKGYQFRDFVQAVDFVNRIKDVAEAEGHHPDLEVGYGKVVVRLTTHSIGGLSENDFILAARIDGLPRD